MDQSGDYVHTVLPYILSLLQRGLGQRIVLLTHSLSPDPEVGMFFTGGKYAYEIISMCFVILIGLKTCFNLLFFVITVVHRA